MSIISKKKFSIAVALVFLSCQGPWSYWPEDPDNYKGIWIYAHVVSGQPVEGVCLEKLLELDETYMPGFAFFENAAINISGPFNGRNATIELIQNLDNPNCFHGPLYLRADIGGDYKLNATVRWDSSGHLVTSKFTAETSIPKRFSIKHAIMPLERDVFREYNRGSNVYYLEPPDDMLNHYFISDHSQDVGGVLVTMAYDIYKVSWGLNSFDVLFPQLAADTGRKAKFGDHDRISYIENIDTIPLSNAVLPIGNNIKLIFYATGEEYGDYVKTDIYLRSDSRVKAKYNISGGAGIFAGMLADTFTINVGIPYRGVAYDNTYARYYYCATSEFNILQLKMETKARWKTDKDCRLFLDEYCDISYRNSYIPQDVACRPVMVAKALDADYTWDSYIRYLRNNDVSEFELLQARPEGEQIWCINNNFSSKVPACAMEYQAAQVSEFRTLAMEALWTWCMDRDWQIHKYPQCGTAMVSWARLGNIKSNILEREVGKWCAENANDPQCIY
jgi:hypothetical protein